MKPDKIFNEDIENTAKNFDWSEFQGTKVLITGATGLIGSQIVKCFLKANELYDLKIKIFPVVRNEEKAKSLFGEPENTKLIVQNITCEIKCDEKIDYIIHCASQTSSKDFVDHPVDVIRTGIHGTENVLEFARASKIKGMIYLSSMEVYGNPDETAGKITETSYAYFDHLKARSSYPESKKMIECMCVAYASQYDVPVKIARLTQTFGSGVAYNDGRVFAEFARCVIESKNIVLHTKGDTVRNYCYVADAVRALLTILLKGKTGEAYNVANSATTISIKDMAELAASLSDGNVKVEFDIVEDISKMGYAPKLIMDLDTSKLESLGWKPEYDLKEMFERTIESMKARR